MSIAIETTGEPGAGLVLALFHEQGRELPYAVARDTIALRDEVQISQRHYQAALLLHRRGLGCPPEAPAPEPPTQKRYRPQDNLPVRRGPQPGSLRDRLLRAALTLAQPFRVEDLVVAAWQRFPGEFGLGGHPHPDSNKVMALLCHKSGPVKGGFLARVKPGVYELTPKGRERAKT